MLPTPGNIVRARSRRYLVEDVVPPPARGDDTLVRLSCLDDDAQGEPLEVLWEREVDADVLTASSHASVVERGFDAPARFAAYLDTLRWSCVSSTSPRLLQAPYRAGIEVMAYQLEPLRKALLLPRVNLFIADDVGLGKTIEAALIARELILRQKVRRIVVACPPSVVLQWQAELEQRFGLRFVVFDRDYVIQKRRERGYGVNAWSTHTRFIVSHALLRDEAYAGPLRDWLAQEQEPGQPRGTLLILDEAHNAAPASGSKYAVDSRFTRIVRELAPRFEHRIFLSATPHNGHSNSFSALLEILDPHRFCRGVKVVPRNLDAVMVRRLKGDLREIGLAFPVRHVVQIDIDGLPDDAPELALARLLDEYRELREAKVKDASKRAQAATTIVLTGLQKRLLSSIEAFASTLRVHRRAVERTHDASAKKRKAAEGQLALIDAPGADDEEAGLPEAEVKEQEEEGLALASEAMSVAGIEVRERELLDCMTEIAEHARGLPDARVRHLHAWLREKCCPDGKWRRPSEDDLTAVGRVLIFTEFSDTKRYLEEQLRTLLARTDRADERIATFHGGMDEEAREEIKRAFNARLDEHPLRVLIATDAAREGVNLQNHCADLFHFDVPWNPSRMEQRNGRIDRKLQRAPEVRCHYFVFAQRPEDRVLAALVKKTKNIQDELGSLAQVLELRLGHALEGGIRRREADSLTLAIETEAVDQERAATVDEELDQSTRARRQALILQIDGLRNLMRDAKEALRLDETAFRAALSASLELLGAQPLQPVPGVEGTWTLPVDDPRLVKDPTWAETLDTLRVPRKRDEKPWEWRRSSPIRPVVFRDTGSLDEHVVHLHLEHRLVQRLLGRFLAQGFVHDDLARAATVVSDDPIPRVALLGRVSLYGDRAARLHDEILAVTARWIDPETRREPLRPYAEDAKSRTLDLVDAALIAGRVPAEPTQKRLAVAVVRDVAELLPHLITLGQERARRADDMLFARGQREGQDLTEVLETQKKRIQAMLHQHDVPQLALPGFNEEERRQVEADVRHWKKRVGELDAELTSEPLRVRTSYETRARRVEPLGIVYLWPVTG
jgi:superfamily II DNA or RNA helicase